MNVSQVALLQGLAVQRKYGRGQSHADQVKKLTLQIYHELVGLGMLTKSDRDEQILDVASLLHDVGLPREPHNEVGFDLVLRYLADDMVAAPVPPDEASALLYCILWHRGSAFVKRDEVDIVDPTLVRKIASIVRVADALDRTLRQVVLKVTGDLRDRSLRFRVWSKQDIGTELRRAKDKADLIKAAYNFVEVSFESAST